MDFITSFLLAAGSFDLVSSPPSVSSSSRKMVMKHSLYGKRSDFDSDEQESSSDDDWMRCIQKGTFNEFSIDNSNNDSDDDDDTVATVSSTEDDSSCSSLESASWGLRSDGEQPQGRSVTWADNLETQVNFRPATASLEEKRRLFYTDVEYRAFRADYMIHGISGRSSLRRPQASGAKVRFAHPFVSAVHSYQSTNSTDEDVPKSELYYSDEELRRFLDDFVASLTSASA